ncbi:protein L-Myc-1b [Electrophorus electricus]|uniref:BHLH domain-containing protein n=1 Tax=Electrophorus electricus TaxID=8005 RepID=A0A4W4G8L1_ELEEL|nr:protein L-Myc-1b [Electrophorus electricus]
MPGISANVPPFDRWEMEEYDQYQHYFYDDHNLDEDFFKSTAPSEDIWKKFELVPTPPMSPIRTLDGTGGAAYPSLGEKLEWVSQFLGQDEEHDGHCKLSTDKTFSNLSSIIIQDCMWSGFSASQRLEKVVSERLSCSGQSKLPFALQTGPTHPSKSQCVPADAPVLNCLATDCVDPAAVLTFPLSNSCKKQVSSGSESRTDSSDDEEIDVVTVEHKHNKPRLVSSRKPVTITVRADPYDPGMKRFHISIHQQQHNYAAPSPQSHPDGDLPRKRVRQDTSHPQTGSTPQALESKPHSPGSAISRSVTASSPHPQFHHGPKSQPSSPQSSDSEDLDRRKNHNFLERKRRNDLRSRFLALRDEIPGLVDCPKTPKVVILTKATEYLRLLHTKDKQKAQEKKHLKNRQQQLLRRLAELRRS